MVTTLDSKRLIYFIIPVIPVELTRHLKRKNEEVNKLSQENKQLQQKLDAYMITGTGIIINISFNEVKTLAKEIFLPACMHVFLHNKDVS